MKILEIKSLVFPEVKTIKFARFLDNRGYFTELYKKSDFQKIDFLKDKVFVQNNESYSKKGVVRGLHFQWNPYQEKLIRTVKGSIIDLFLDIRLGSPTFGKIGVFKLETKSDDDFCQWIWLPKGFAHGLYMLEDSTIEYFCTSEYSAQTEASISPFAPEIDWSLVDKEIAEGFKNNLQTAVISEKDRNGSTLTQWQNDPRSKFYQY